MVISVASYCGAADLFDFLFDGIEPLHQVAGLVSRGWDPRDECQRATGLQPALLISATELIPLSGRLQPGTVIISVEAVAQDLPSVTSTRGPSTLSSLPDLNR